jgi:beta-lactamase class A
MRKRCLLCILCLLCVFMHSMANGLNELESSTGVKIGLSALNLSNGETIEHRSNERFATGSTYKFMVASAVLKNSMGEPKLLNEKIRINQDEIHSWAPITEKHIGKALSIQSLVEAALSYSDNTAANLLTKRIGGPESLTEFARSIGDKEFINTHYEPVDTTPGNTKDSTTPLAMRISLEKIMLGEVLGKSQRAQLKDWMVNNTTGDTRIRAGVPKGWLVADKTGSGYYGVRNDIGVIWVPSCQPIILTIYTTQDKKDATPKDEVLAEATRMVIEEFAKKDACISEQIASYYKGGT